MAQDTQGVLGVANTPFAGSATISSETYLPRDRASTVTITAIATRAGDCRIYLVDAAGVEHVQGSAAVSSTAGVANTFRFDGALRSAFTVRIKFTDTSGLAGTVTFYVTDGGT